MSYEKHPKYNIQDIVKHSSYMLRKHTQ